MFQETLTTNKMSPDQQLTKKEFKFNSNKPQQLKELMKKSLNQPKPADPKLLPEELFLIK